MIHWRLAAALFLMGLWMTNANAITNLLTTYSQLVKALEAGDDVKAIIHLDKCQISDPAIQIQLAQNLDGASTRINFTQFLHDKIRVNGQLKDTVITSTNTVIERSSGVFLTAFGRLSMYDDNTGVFHIDFFDPKVHKSQLVVDWLCDISNGNDDHGLFLFDSM